MVQRFTCRARRDVLGNVWRRYGNGVSVTAARHMGLVPTIPNIERLSANGW